MAPRFVFLDEPAAGTNDAECDELMALITRIPERFGCSVLLIEHNMRLVMGVCHRIPSSIAARRSRKVSPPTFSGTPR